jgi:hypothetical protein
MSRRDELLDLAALKAHVPPLGSSKGDNEQAEQFRRKAKECEFLADTASDDFIAEEYLNLAKQCREIADQLERHNLGR